MPKQNLALLKYNRGIVSRKALARTDIERIQDSAEIQYNYVPQVLGPMMLRPGLEHLLTSGTTKPKYLPFVFRVDDTALPEFTGGIVKIVKDDEYLLLPNISTAVTNGDFSPDLTGWTDADDAGATSEFAGAVGGALVALTNRGVYDFDDLTTPRARYKLDNDGFVYTMREVQDGGVYQQVTGEWKLNGASADYEAYTEHLSGPPPLGSVLNTWLNLGTDREWYQEDLVGGSEIETIIRVKIRLVGGTEALVTANISLQVLLNGGGIPP